MIYEGHHKTSFTSLLCRNLLCLHLSLFCSSSLPMSDKDVPQPCQVLWEEPEGHKNSSALGTASAALLTNIPPLLPVIYRTWEAKNQTRKIGGEVSTCFQLPSPRNQQNLSTATAPALHNYFTKGGAGGEQKHPNNTGALRAF